jgi:hypothetical protein
MAKETKAPAETSKKKGRSFGKGEKANLIAAAVAKLPAEIQKRYQALRYTAALAYHDAQGRKDLGELHSKYHPNASGKEKGTAIAGRSFLAATYTVLSRTGSMLQGTLPKEMSDAYSKARGSINDGKYDASVKAFLFAWGAAITRGGGGGMKISAGDLPTSI